MSENPEVQLTILQATINFQNREIERLEQELARAIASKDTVERELGRVKNDLTNTERNFAIREEQLRNAREVISNYTNGERRKNLTAILLVILANLLFLLSNILIGFGVNMLTSSPPVELGHTILILGGSAYLIAAVMTGLITALGGK